MIAPPTLKDVHVPVPGDRAVPAALALPAGEPTLAPDRHLVPA
jgi:hypothetical protein